MSRGNIARFALLALVWGTGFLWIKIALRGFDPVQIVFARLALGALVLAPILWTRHLRLPAGWRTWTHLTVAALFANALPYVLVGIGEQTVGSNVAGVLNATTPLWTVVLALATGVDQVLTTRRAAGLVTGFLGAILIFAPWRDASDIASVGGLVCLAAAASYAVSYIYMSRYLAARGIPPIVLSAAQLTAATGLLAVAMPIAGLTTPVWRADAVIAVLILGVPGTGFAYVLNYRLIADEGPTVASTVIYVLPVVAIVLGALVLHEPLTPEMTLGTLLILGGVAIVKLSPVDNAVHE